MGKVFLFASHQSGVCFTVYESFVLLPYSHSSRPYTFLLCECKSKHNVKRRVQTVNRRKNSNDIGLHGRTRYEPTNEERYVCRHNIKTIQICSGGNTFACIRIYEASRDRKVKVALCENRSWNKSDAFLTSANNLLDMQINGPYQIRASSYCMSVASSY